MCEARKLRSASHLPFQGEPAPLFPTVSLSSPGCWSSNHPRVAGRCLKPHRFYGSRQQWQSPLVPCPSFWKEKPCCLKTAPPVTGRESRAAPQEPRAVPLGLPSALHAQEPRLRLTAGPLRDVVPGFAACLPCRAGIMGVCSSTDVTLGATGILGLRKRFTCLAPGSSLAPMRWVAPASLYGSDLPSPRPAHPAWGSPLLPPPCLSFQIVLFEKEKRGSGVFSTDVRRWAGPGPNSLLHCLSPSPGTLSGQRLDPEYHRALPTVAAIENAPKVNREITMFITVISHDADFSL